MKKDEIDIEVLRTEKPGVAESPRTSMNFGCVSILRRVGMNDSALKVGVLRRSLGQQTEAVREQTRSAATQQYDFTVIIVVSSEISR